MKIFGISEKMNNGKNIEQIANIWYRIFYIFMIVIYIQFIVRSYTFNIFEILLFFLGSLNVVFYIFLFIYSFGPRDNLKKMGSKLSYFNSVTILRILIPTTILFCIFMICYKTGYPDPSQAIFDVMIEHFFIIWALFLRIFSVERLKHVLVEMGLEKEEQTTGGDSIEL